jgi:hypothetical protein
LNKLKTIEQKINGEISEILKNPKAAIEKVKAGKPLTAKSSAFGGSAFGSPSKPISAFGNSTSTSNPFSVLGSNSTPFGNSSFGNLTTATTANSSGFGGKTLGISSGQTTGFGQSNSTQSNAFGHSNSAFASSMTSSAFGKSLQTNTAFGQSGFGNTSSRSSAFANNSNYSTGFGQSSFAPENNTSSNTPAFGTSFTLGGQQSAFGVGSNSQFSAFSNPQNSTFGSTSGNSAFGSSGVGAIQSGFGFGTNPSNSTANNNQSSTFGNAATLENNVNKGSIPPSSFAKVNSTADNSAFTTPQNSPQKNGFFGSTAHGKAQMIHSSPLTVTMETPNGNTIMTPQDIEKAFRSRRFEFGRIPEIPPA